jgi:hypothetical protein
VYGGAALLAMCGLLSLCIAGWTGVTVGMLAISWALVGALAAVALDVCAPPKEEGGPAVADDSGDAADGCVAACAYPAAESTVEDAEGLQEQDRVG